MNYLNTYISLVRKAEIRDFVDGYTENHHIFPISIFGMNSRTVKLTAREHYIAHALLERICLRRYGKDHWKTKKMTYAFFFMNNAKSKGQLRYFNSRIYEHFRVRYVESISGENHHFFNKKRIFSDEHLKNLRESRKSGEESPLYNLPRPEYVKEKIRKSKQNISKDTRERMSKGRIGMKFSKSHRKNLSKSHLGKIPANKGTSKYTLEITSPDGSIEVTNELYLYCVKHDIPDKMEELIRVARGARKSYKKFTCRIVHVKADTK